MVPVITIDGPSGSGKGTVSRAVAARLGFHFLDSGALYRAVALRCAQQGVDLSDAQAAADSAARAQIAFVEQGELDPIVLLNGVDVSAQLRTESTGAIASQVAAHPPVRQVLVALQRAQRIAPGLVADGRDMGTVIFPDAALKIFLEASVDERATRRHKQLLEKGFPATIPELLSEIAARDRRDRTRAVAPLIAASDAIVLDSTGMTVEAVVAAVCSLAVDALSGRGKHP